MGRVSRCCLLLLLIAVAADARAAQERYYSLLIENKKAGYGHYRIAAEGKGVKVTSDTVIKVKMLGADFDLSYQAIAVYARPGDALPLRYTITLDTGRARTTADSRFAGRTVRMQIETNGVKTAKTVTLPAAPCYLVEGNLVETWERLGRAVGPSPKTRTVRIFAPLSGEIAPMTLTWSRPGTLAASVSGQALETRWSGRTLTALSVPAQKAVFRLADKTALRGVGAVEMASRAFATSNVAFDDPSALQTVTLSVRATVAGEKITAASLQTPGQTFRGTVRDNTATGAFTIRRRTYDGAGAAPLPFPAAARAKWAKYLKPETLVESDDPEIVALAKRLTAGSKNVWEATGKIGRWVFENIAYKITGAGARACLTAREGDCGPHTWLTIALLRAAGIPARISGGALYSTLLGGSFGQHYWTSVWMGEKDGWIPIDTTTGEIGSFGPTHLTLWNQGGLAGLTVRVVDYAPKTRPESAVAAGVDLPRRPLQLKADERWEFVITQEGKIIGKESAHVARLDADGGAEIAYAAELAVPQGKVDLDGVFAVAADGRPRRLRLKVVQAGITQSVTVEIKNDRAAVLVEAAGQKINRDTDLPPGASLVLNLVATTWDVLLRSLPGDEATRFEAPLYFPDALRQVRATFTVLREESITLGGQDVACRVLRASEAGAIYHVRKDTGHLARITTAGGKLVIERQIP